MAAFFQGLVVTLREGVEAALLVALILAALDRTGRRSLRGSVYAGLGVALAASVAVAAILRRVPVNEEAFEGYLYLAAAVMVGSMLVWMNRHARGLRHEVEARVGRLSRDDSAGLAAVGLFLFTFLNVFREGVETALFLGVLSFNSEGLNTVAGGLAGLAMAIVFALFFIRGSLRVDLPRFFRVTTIVLAIFVAQLLLNGVHELSEAGILPSGPLVMAIVGPIVQQNTLLLAAVLLIPVLLLLIPARPRPDAAAAPGSAADRRKATAAGRRAQRGRLVAAAAGIAIVLLLGVDSIGSTLIRRQAALSPAASVTPVDGVARVPVAQLVDGRLHRYQVGIAGKPVRFLLMRRKDGSIASAFDACLLCGDRGYSQEGESILCANCAAEINPASIGQGGGCNPIPLSWRIDGDAVAIAAADLAAGAKHFHRR
jgi:FTR1 family protein